MCHREIHHQGERRGETVVLCLRFLQDSVVFGNSNLFVTCTSPRKPSLRSLKHTDVTKYRSVAKSHEVSSSRLSYTKAKTRMEDLRQQLDSAYTETTFVQVSGHVEVHQADLIVHLVVCLLPSCDYKHDIAQIIGIHY
jgi:hypothetical protein